MLHPQPFTIASVAKTLDDLKKLPRDEQATALLRRLLHLYPQVRGSGGLHKGSLLLPNDPYSLATGFDISENMPVRLYLLGTPWNRLVNEGYLIDPNGNGFFSISDDGMEALQKLETIKGNSLRVLRLLETAPRTSESETEIRDLTALLKVELQAEYERMLPESVQRKLSMFEISIYSPTIEETWRETGISRLRTDGVINKRWSEVLESIVYNTSKYTS